MIFAHGPAGFLSAWLLKRFWLQQKKRSWLYFVAFFGGIFPDLDLFYYYLFDASSSHREIFTHSLFFYLLIFIAVYSFARIKKHDLLKKINLVFFIGVLSHLFFDALGAGIALLYPFSSELYGWARFSWFDQSVFGQNLFATNYILEAFIITHTGVAMVWWLFKKAWIKKVLLVVLEILFIASIVFIAIINQHIFKGVAYTYYGDLDEDGVVNRKDIDMDGDELFNFMDTDANGNNFLNNDELIYYIKKSKNVWYDPTNGGLLEIPLRMGLVTNTEFIKRSYELTGIYFRKEMRDDYQNNTFNYKSTPKSSKFDRDIDNWYAWLKHQGRLLPTEKENYQVGRLVFYGHEKDQLNHAAIIVEVNPEMIIVADATPEKNVRIVSEQVVLQEFGAAQYIGLIYQD